MKIKINKRNYILIKELAALVIVILSAAMFGSCKGGLADIPPSYFEIIEGPAENEVLNVDQAYFKWRGSSASFDYRFKLMIIDRITKQPAEYLEFTEWNSETDKLFDNLDEGLYVFQIQASYAGADPITLERRFEVDAVQGPSVLFYKTETIGELGNYAEVNIWIEDMDSLTVLSFGVNFDKSMVELDSVAKGDFITGLNMEQFLAPEISLVKEEVNQKGSVLFTTGFMPQAGNSAKSISGAGKIVKLIFYIADIGRSSLEFYSIEARDVHGNRITVKTKNGIINGVN